jgi:hypothetical protein
MPRFDAPIHTERHGALDPTTKPVKCSCPESPWCSGPAGPYWLSCSAACRSCHPRPRRRPGAERLRGEHDDG